MTRPLSSLTATELDAALDIAGIPVSPAIVEASRLPTVDQVGLGYLARFAELGVEMRLERIRESRGDVSCELTVTRFGMHLLRQRFNLASGPARSTAARDLDRLPRPKEWTKVDWRELLEMTCLGVLDQYRSGEPFTLVGHRPPTDRAARRLIDPFLPLARPTLIYGAWGAGKSTVGAAIVATLQLAAEIIPGWAPPPEPVNCLVLDWESTPEEWNDRLAAIAAGAALDLPIDQAPMYRACRTPLDDQVEKLAEVIAKNGIGFVLIDSAEKAIGASSAAETYGDRAGRLFEAIDQLGVTVVILDHVSGDDLKRSDGRPIRKAIGSTMKGAWSRAVYELKRERDPDTIAQRVELVLHTMKVNDAAPQPPFEFAIVYADDGIIFERSRVTAPDLTAGLSRPEQMARYLVNGSQSTEAIASALDVPQNLVRSILSKDHGRRFLRLPDGTIGLAL